MCYEHRQHSTDSIENKPMNLCECEQKKRRIKMEKSKSLRNGSRLQKRRALLSSPFRNGKWMRVSLMTSLFVNCPYYSRQNGRRACCLHHDKWTRIHVHNSLWFEEKAKTRTTTSSQKRELELVRSL